MSQLIHEQELQNHPELAGIVAEVDQAVPPIGYERLLYRHLFVMTDDRKYLRVVADDRNKLIVPLHLHNRQEHDALSDYCDRHGWKLLVLDGHHDWLVRDARPVPIGVWHDIDLASFHLDGRRMRKLRYLVQKFAKSGTPKLFEPDRPAATERASMCEVMLAWAGAKKNVIEHSVVCMEEILAGGLKAGHRAFVTYLDDTLCSVIVIEDAGSGKWIMDQEFYDPGAAPLGHMEYAVCEIIKLLQSEGAQSFSLGLTWFPDAFADHPDKDDEGWEWLSAQVEKGTLLSKVFELGRANFQFKKKFAPDDQPFFAYFPDGMAFETLLKFWPVFMQNSLTAAQVADRLAEQVREDDASTVPAEIDLRTDSWWGRENEHTARLRSRDRTQLIEDAKAFRALIPFKHVFFTPRGRDAEALFYKAFAQHRRQRRIMTALPWTTTLAFQLGNGFRVEELPHPTILNAADTSLFKGEIDLEGLAEALAVEHADDIAMVGIEALSNAAGGAPVRLSHLRELRGRLAGSGIPLVLDATRIVRNAALIKSHEPGLHYREIWDLVRETLSSADHVVASLAKDFAISQGGLIATDDEDLARSISSLIADGGFESEGGTPLSDPGWKAPVIPDLDLALSLVEKQLRFMERIARMAAGRHPGPIGPVLGHALVLDVAALDADPDAFLQDLLTGTGIKGGRHQAGKQRQSALAKAVRLAVPLGLSASDEERILHGLERFLQKPQMPSSIEVADHDDDIAIIGVSGRFPMANTPEELWENLRAGKDCVTEIPADRWNWRDFYEADRNSSWQAGKSTSKWGGFIDRHDRFDAAFFGIAPREARIMDPQERLFLEVAWAAFEDAGYNRSALKFSDSLGREPVVSVHVGCSWQEYGLFGGNGLQDRSAPIATFAANIANRVSYWFDLKGESLTLDTACSSSLSALHQACKALRQGESDMALVGGVNLSLHPNKYLLMSQGQFLSSTGRCKSFGDGGDGYVPSEAISAVLVKPLGRARLDGDHIYGVIRGSAVRHAGKTNGYSVPNPAAQAEVIRDALENAKVAPTEIGYIEAHGTGTVLGDPVEIEGLSKVFGTRDPLPVGSVKSNLGHCEAAAGLVGLTKVLMQFKHRSFAPSLHAQPLNPKIRFAQSPFFVQDRFGPWTTPEGNRRMAGISSFGASGTNVHVIVEEFISEPGATEPGTTETEALPEAIILSARNEEDLMRLARSMSAFLRKNPGIPFDGLAYTLQTGREPLRQRLGFTASSTSAVIDRLDAFCEGRRDDVVTGRAASGPKNGSPAAPVEGDDLERMVEVWVRGGDVPWNRMERKRRPIKQSLPTYPFDGPRYWVEDNASRNVRKADVRFLEELWQDVPVPQIRQGSGAALPRVLCLLSSEKDQAELGGILKTYLEGSEILFLRDDGQTPEDLAAAIQEIGRVDGVLYLWPIENPERAQDLSVVLGLLKELTSLGFPKRVMFAGRDAGALGGVHLDSLVAIERSLSMAHPNSAISAFTMAEEGWEAASKAQSPERKWLPIVQSFLAERIFSFKYDGETWRRPEVREVTAPGNEPGHEETHPIDLDRPILITGGSNGLGFQLADHLVSRGARKLVLTGRAALAGDRRRRLADLEGKGCRVHYLQGDVTDRAVMEAGLEEARHALGAIGAVFHVAGVMEPKALSEKTSDEFSAVLAAKVTGPQVLDALLAGDPLTLVCYFSSLSALLGDFGFCDYAMANRFMSGYAAYRNALAEKHECTGRAVSIQWPLWREGGMGGGGTEWADFYLDSSGQRLLEAGEGFDLLDRIIAGNSTVCTPLVCEGGAFERIMAGLNEEARWKETARPSVRHAAQTPCGVVVQDALLADLRVGVIEVLGIDERELEDDARFTDFGFDSISLSEFSGLLTSGFGFDVTPDVFFGAPTLNDLTAYLLEEHGAALEALFGASSEEGAAAPVPEG
ncbi:SDR family NAD(P)-dependent oxidoreductase, partial [Nisaea nitritireducens]|uniref:SDR family NAD(P)-dependent oxidoreductase n=1 Tax=Nisaea nitritireducens TaxID=568392 RepID=UPI00186958B1